MLAAVGLDTIKIRSQIGAGIRFEPDQKAHQKVLTVTDSGEQFAYEIWNYREVPGPYIRRNVDSGQITVEMSAKILGSDYLRGFSEHTWDRASNRTKDLFGLDLAEPLDWHPGRADVTVNLGVNDCWPYLFAIKHGLTWDRKKTDARYSETALFWNASERLTCYDKLAEMPELRHDVQGEVLRIEYQAKRFSRLRDRIGNPAVYLNSWDNKPAGRSGNGALRVRPASKPDPVKSEPSLAFYLDSRNQKIVSLDVWRSLRRIQLDWLGIGIRDLMRKSGLNIGKIRRIYGDILLLERLNGDRAAVSDLLKASFPKQTASRVLKEMRQSWEFDRRETQNCQDLISELDERIEAI